MANRPKIAFMGRVGPETDVYANAIASEGALELFIAETGQAARRRKWARMRRDRGLSRAAIDAAALSIFNAVVGRRLGRALAGKSRPAPRPHLTVVDANEPIVARGLRSHNIDILIIHGTALLGEDVLQACPRVLNIHGGIVPEYRNVYGDFWALARGRPQDVGFSLLRVTPGIDDGPVLLTQAVGFASPVRLSEARAAICLQAAQSLRQIIRSGVLSGALEGSSQEGPAGFHRTPTAVDLLRGGVRP